METLTDRVFTLKYDPVSLELTELSALTFEKELTAGNIAAAGVNIISVAPGEIVYRNDS